MIESTFSYLKSKSYIKEENINITFKAKWEIYFIVSCNH